MSSEPEYLMRQLLLRAASLRAWSIAPVCLSPMLLQYVATGLLLAIGILSEVARAEDDSVEQQGITIDSVVLSPFEVAELPAQQTGVLRELSVAEGATVEAGAVIARLDSRQAALDVAKAELETARAKAQATNELKRRFAEKSAEVAEAEVRRSEESIAQFAKSISQSQLDVERLTVEKLALEGKQAAHEQQLDRFTLQLKEQELVAARLRLAQHEIVAPFAGTVSLVRGRVGEWVEIGESVARLVAVDRLQAEGFLDEPRASAELVGKPVVFRTHAESGEFSARGTLKFVSPEMDPVTRQVRVWAEIQNTEGTLRAGQQGTLEIVTQQ